MNWNIYITDLLLYILQKEKIAPKVAATIGRVNEPSGLK